MGLQTPVHINRYATGKHQLARLQYASPSHADRALTALRNASGLPPRVSVDWWTTKARRARKGKRATNNFVAAGAKASADTNIAHLLAGMADGFAKLQAAMAKSSAGAGSGTSSF